MANIMTVVVKGEVPSVVRDLPEVKWYGNNPIVPIESSDLRKPYGDTIIYTAFARNTISFLINQLGFKKEDIFWQDLDGYGEAKLFPCLDVPIQTDLLTEADYWDGDESDNFLQ